MGTASTEPHHQLASAAAAARLHDKQNNEVEDALRGHDDEDCADPGLIETEIVLIERHTQRAAVVYNITITQESK